MFDEEYDDGVSVKLNVELLDENMVIKQGKKRFKSLKLRQLGEKSQKKKYESKTRMMIYLETI